MTNSDATLIYGDGTFEEHVQELVNYLAREFGEDSEARSAFIKPFQESLLSSEASEEKQRKTIVLVLGAVKTLGNGNDREIEGFFNLLYAYVLDTFTSPEALAEQLTPLIHVISAAPDHTTSKYRILANLFNLLPTKSPLRLQVYKALLKAVSAQDDIDLLGINTTTVEQWLTIWGVPSDEKSALWKAISDAYGSAGQPEKSYTYLLQYVNSLSPSSPEAATASQGAIATAIRLPSITDFQSLARLEAVKAASQQPIYALLHIFIAGDYAQLQMWLGQNEGHIASNSLERDAIERKLRLLAVANLGTKNVGKDLPYDAIASALHIPAEEVEAWVINAMRAGLIGGKLSQPTRTFHITRATHLSFNKDDWASLEKKLIAWKSELLGVLDVLSNTKTQASRGHASSGRSRATAQENGVPETDKGISTSA